MSESPLPPEEASEGERSRRDGPVIRLLSLDGGGLRGVIQLRILMALEELTGRGAATLFDVIAGTSTGGVLALGLCRPGPDGKPALRAEDIYDRYIEYAPIIFVKPTVRSLPELVRSRKGRRAARQRVGALLDPGRYGNARHPADGLEALYRRFLGDARLSDAITDVIIPSYDWKAGRAVVFRSRAAAGARA